MLCQLSGVQEFGRVAFPRGAYLEGRLEADREPGHFFGKGYLRLEFDRIGLPNTDVPVPSKVVALRGYRVDRGWVDYVLETGTAGAVDVKEVDWVKTSQLNSERGQTPAAVTVAQAD